MKRAVWCLLLATACRTVVIEGNPTPTTGTIGADSPRAAVEGFLAAAKSDDMARLGRLFGDETGLAKDRDDKDQFEKRQIIMICTLKHDQATVTDGAATVGGERVFQVDLKQGTIQGSSKFTAVRGPGERWFVKGFDIVALQNKGFCQPGNATKRP